MGAELFEPFETGDAFVALRGLMHGPHPPLALVGSGASVNSAYPSWSGLLSELRDMAGRKALAPKRQGALREDQAWEAEVYYRAIGPKRFETFIQEKFKEPAALAEPHHTIAALPFRHFLTTNYDPCIEMALAAQSHAFQSVCWEDGPALSRFLINLSQPTTTRSVVYVHGRFDRPKGAVLTESAYVERYIQSDDARRKLLAIFITHPVVFIGFSMNDPDFANLMREVTARLRTSPAAHYVLLAYDSEVEREDIRARMSGQYGVEPIFYSYDKNGPDKHANLLRLLRALAPSRLAKHPPFTTGAETLSSPPPAKDPNDPHKNQWGGSAEANGRRARVRKLPRGARGMTVKFELIVEALPGAAPLNGEVQFHMHPTFEETVYVRVADGKRAVLEKCEAYGAFTVGISADRGSTRLELDLAQETDLPEWFRRR